MGVLIFDDRDAAITYSGTWSPAGSDREFNSTTTWTTTEGATARLTFLGTKISVFGTVAARSRPESSYVVDNNNPVTFQGTLARSVEYNQLFFESPTLPEGEHTLTITNLADDEDSALFLDLITVAPLQTPLVTTVTTTASPSTVPARTVTQTVVSTIAAPSLSPNTNTGESSGSEAGTSAPSKTNAGAIAGGIIGAIVLLLLLAAGFFLYRRRRRQKDDSPDSYWSPPNMAPAPGGVVPFPPPTAQANPPQMSQAYGAYPSSYEYPASQGAGRPYAPSNAATSLAAGTSPPSELAYYNSGDYDPSAPNTQAYSQAPPSTWSAPTTANNFQSMGKNGRVRINLND